MGQWGQYVPYMEYIGRTLGPGVYLGSPAPDLIKAVVATSDASKQEKMDDDGMSYLVAGEYSTREKHRLCQE
jgi:hypothetical protein